MEPCYSNPATGNPPFPSDDTRDFIELTWVLLQRIWRDCHHYLKAGVMLRDFSPTEEPVNQSGNRVPWLF
ncbi:hypothetical protein [Hahella sp. CR1]|uniref:DinB/UmuC family translesion DNA polymerase n=1 Tax=Hahella sp. CR1 TaxID=2992807 RepID=UPI0032617CCE